MLSSAPLVGFVATAAPEAARQFYQSVLGLTLLEDTPFAFVFEAGGNTLRVQKVPQVRPPPYTALGWAVRDIRATVRALGIKGVAFQRYEGLQQDELGIWRTPGGGMVAWFRDPDGNTLSLSEAPPE